MTWKEDKVKKPQENQNIQEYEEGKKEPRVG
jgi:hypothetical protein